MEESEDSASAFEIDSDERLSSPESRNRDYSLNRSTPNTPTRSSTSKRRRSATKLPRQPSKASKNIPAWTRTDSEILEDVAEWAAKFEPPRIEDIKTPPRGKRVHRYAIARKKDFKLEPSKVRAKRLKPYHSDEYRLLLNNTIQDAAIGMLEDEYEDYVESRQIGSSLWTSRENDIFFSALGRLGRDNTCGIAARIGSKSEIEVHEYILLLDEGVRQRHNRSARLLQSVEVPAALEISEECCAVLERAGDALTSRQERASEKVDRQKWGDSWLLTQESSRWIEKKIVQKGGEQEIEEVLPAANLLNLANWLKLSRKVFMNSGGRQEEDNWTKICEPGETPAIRATAFEDFHSLTVNITKRILSTVLFCTMSRLRASEPGGTKHAEIRSDDVEAAVQLLGLKSNSNDYWINCPRRCNLDIVNDGEEDETLDDDDSEDNDTDGSQESDEENEEAHMTYPSIEANLRTTVRPSRSRSRSMSRRPRTPEHIEQPLSSPARLSSREPSVSRHASIVPSSSSEKSLSPSPSRSTHYESEADTEVDQGAALEAAQDSYAQTMDMHHSSREETRLWKMLRQTPPFEIEVKSVLDLRFPKSLSTDIESRQWRDYMEYVSSWEKFETPVQNAAFEQNRARMARKGKRKAAEVFSEDDEDGDGDSSVGGESAEEQGDRAGILDSREGQGDRIEIHDSGEKDEVVDHLSDNEIEREEDEPTGSGSHEALYEHKEEEEEEDEEMGMEVGTEAEDAAMESTRAESPTSQTSHKEKSPSIHSRSQSPPIEWDFHAEFQQQTGA